MSDKEKEKVTTSGDDKEVLTLVAADGKEFAVPKKAALASGTIKDMLRTPQMEGEDSGKINFREISSSTMEKVVAFMEYKSKYDGTTRVQVPPFPFEPDYAIELFLAANFLDL